MSDEIVHSDDDNGEDVHNQDDGQENALEGGEDVPMADYEEEGGGDTTYPGGGGRPTMTMKTI